MVLIRLAIAVQRIKTRFVCVCVFFSLPTPFPFNSFLSVCLSVSVSVCKDTRCCPAAHRKVEQLVAAWSPGGSVTNEKKKKKKKKNLCTAVGSFVDW